MSCSFQRAHLSAVTSVNTVLLIEFSCYRLEIVALYIIEMITLNRTVHDTVNEMCKDVFLCFSMRAQSLIHVLVVMTSGKSFYIQIVI